MNFQGFNSLIYNCFLNLLLVFESVSLLIMFCLKWTSSPVNISSMLSWAGALLRSSIGPVMIWSTMQQLSFDLKNCDSSNH